MVLKNNCILIFYPLRSHAPAELKKNKNAAMENNRNADGFIFLCIIYHSLSDTFNSDTNPF